MKRFFLMAVLSVGLSLDAIGAMFTGGLGNGTTIADGSMNGLANSVNVSGLASSLSSIQVNITLTTPYAGDLYAYLSYNGTAVILMNRVGVSSTDAFGNPVSLSSGVLSFVVGGTDIHTSLTGAGTYGVDGRAISPLSSPSAFDAAGTTSLSQYNGADPNGTWTLFFADTVSGGGNSSLVSWELDITAVPEPTNIALGVFGVLMASASIGSWLRRRTAQAEAQ